MLKMTLDDHKRVGAAIQNALEELSTAGGIIFRGVPKSSQAMRHFLRAHESLEKVRCKLEDRMCEEYPMETDQFSDSEFFSYYYAGTHYDASNLNPYLSARRLLGLSKG